jgi:hypothetical protein
MLIRDNRVIFNKDLYQIFDVRVEQHEIDIVIREDV